MLWAVLGYSYGEATLHGDGREGVRPWTGYRVITGLTYGDNNTHTRTYRQFWVSLILALPAELDLWPPKSNQFVLEPKRVLVPKWKNICHSSWHLWHLYSQEFGRVPSSLLKKMQKTDSFLLCMCIKLGILLKSKCYRILNSQQWSLQGRGFFMDYVYLQYKWKCCCHGKNSKSPHPRSLTRKASQCAFAAETWHLSGKKGSISLVCVGINVLLMVDKWWGKKKKKKAGKRFACWHSEEKWGYNFSYSLPSETNLETVLLRKMAASVV